MGQDAYPDMKEQAPLPLPDPVLRERARCVALAQATSARWAKEKHATDRHRKIAMQVADAIATAIRLEYVPPWMLLDDFTEDERLVLVITAERIRKGRASYGPLVIEGDARNFRREATEELIDATVYAAIESIRMHRNGGTP